MKDLISIHDMSREEVDEVLTLVKDLKALLLRYIDEGRSTPGEAQANDRTVLFNRN